MKRSRLAIGLSLILAMAPTISPAAPQCTIGELFAGAPDYADPAERAKDGQGLLAVPPLGFRSLLFAGDKLVTTVRGPELWYSDLAAATPVLKRVAGRESDRRESRPGKCNDARFGNISGIALLPDGSIAGADQEANNLFVVTDPFGPACEVAFLAGATKPQVPLSPGTPDNVGDADGPGARALLRGPDWVAALDDGTIYFIDTGNRKLKKILTDPAHTVATVATLPDGAYYSMVALDGKLYTIANNASSEGFLLEIDPGSGAVREVKRGRSDVWLGSRAINLSGLATDGTGLFTTQSGEVLYVTPDGEVESIAGNGTYVEFQPGYDVRQPHPAAELQLWTRPRTSTAGANVFLAYNAGNLYLSAVGVTSYVERIACQ